ncbi:hypothetical protein [Cytobacillus sp. IB215665]|uniref:hypothetical protein n=1 Tax=Cytobacillus sp. IB215665 TaxID=3097357 RepID=UPI002A14C612|nr:hypothetical protein [Cytobacillus sp. IB215665]MDX8363627.1 hypothetical protein [Cytobacillus sp. IB215665]
MHFFRFPPPRPHPHIHPGGSMLPFPGSTPFHGTQTLHHAPSAPPPSFVPQQHQPDLQAIDPRALVRCLYRYTYIWLRGRRSFWFYPTFIGRKSVSGYRWTGVRWVYFGIDAQRIISFQCF